MAMVKNRAIALLAICSLLSGSCSWWGEKSRPRSVVEQASSGPSCPPAIDIAAATDDAASSAAFECWAERMNGVWKDVQGQERNRITDAEIGTLIRKGILKLSDLPNRDPELEIARALAAKKLLGFGPALTRPELDAWISWARTHRGWLRTFYRTLVSPTDSVAYGQIRVAADLISAFLRKSGWSFSSEELGSLAATFLAPSDTYLRRSMIPIARAALNIIGAVCPNTPKHWDAGELAQCPPSLIGHFEPSATWLESFLNPRTDRHDEVDILVSLNRTVSLVGSWFTQASLSPIDTRLWIQIGRALGMDITEKSLDSLSWITRFNSNSTRTHLHPSIALAGFDWIWWQQQELLSTRQHFVRAVREGNCLNQAKGWRDCRIEPTEELRKIAPAIDLTLKIRNPHFAAGLLPLDGARVAKTLLYYSTAKKVVEVFDEDRDELINVDTKEDRNEVLQLLYVALNLSEHLDWYGDTLSRRLKRMPVRGIHGPNSIRRLDLKGVAKLATMTGELLVARTKDERIAFEKVLSNVFNLFPRSTMHLDTLGLTAVLSTLDSLGEFRAAFYRQGIIRKEGPDGSTLIERGSAVAALPGILKEHFPRLYRSCEDFGFERSCGIALDEMFADPDPGETTINAGDLDLWTMIAASMEGLVDTCDEDGNSLLSWNILDGNDELDCGFIRSKDIATRLMDAKILENDRGLRAGLDAINATFITRVVGKIAMVRGTRKDVGFQVPVFFLFNHASMGSMFGLLSEIANQERVEKLERAGR